MLTRRVLSSVAIAVAVIVAGSSRLASAQATTYPDRASFLDATTVTTSVDFNDIAAPGGVALFGFGGSFVSKGVTFRTYPANFLYVFPTTFPIGCVALGSGHYALASSAGGNPTGEPSLLEITFTQPVSAVGFDAAVVNSATITITLSSGETIPYNLTGCANRFVGFTTDSPITSLTIVTSGIPPQIAMDDFVIADADGCGDERDDLIAQYKSLGVNLHPGCDDFINTPFPAPSFTFAELKSPDAAWAILRYSLLLGLEVTRAQLMSPVSLESGYRTPQHQYDIDTAASRPYNVKSPHQFGTAADIKLTRPWKQIRNAAKAAGACVEPQKLAPGHVHADWRPNLCPVNW